MDNIALSLAALWGESLGGTLLNHPYTLIDKCYHTATIPITNNFLSQKLLKLCKQLKTKYHPIKWTKYGKFSMSGSWVYFTLFSFHRVVIAEIMKNRQNFAWLHLSVSVSLPITSGCSDKIFKVF